MFMRDRVPDLAPRCVSARSDTCRRTFVWKQRMCGNGSLNFIENLFRLVRPAMNKKPARAFRNPTPKENDDESERGADTESEPPPEPDRETIRIEEKHCRSGAHGRANPIRTVDHQIHAATDPRRN